MLEIKSSKKFLPAFVSTFLTSIPTYICPLYPIDKKLEFNNPCGNNQCNLITYVFNSIIELQKLNNESNTTRKTLFN